MSRGDKDSGVTPSGDFSEDEVGSTRVRDTLVGAQLGEFLIDGRLGEGAMGIVYRGLQPVIGRAVAVKVMKQGFDADGLLAEARALASARHPNIIDILSFGQTPAGQPYFVMELLDGEALDVWLRNHQPTPLQIASILKQLFSALSAAHAANVVHRDLKPANIFLASLPDDGLFVKILDFGLAKRVDPKAPEFTHGKIAGTPLYMAPEQVRGQVTGPYTDLYAMGCIAWELFTGGPPFTAPALIELMGQHLRSPPPPLPPGLPQGVPELLLALLEKEPGKRPASAIAARQQVDRIERKLLVAAGTNVQLPQLNQQGVPVRARVPLALEELAATPPETRPAVQAVKRAPVETELVVPAVKRSRKPAAVRATEQHQPEQEERPTTLSHVAQSRPPQRTWWWWLVLVPVACAVAIAVWPRDAPVVTPKPQVIVEKTPEPVPPPEPVEVVTPPAPEPAPVDEPARVVKKPARNVQLSKRLAKLEERCLLELTDNQQRLALADFRDLKDEVEKVPPEKARELLREFEQQWLK